MRDIPGHLDRASQYEREAICLAPASDGAAT